MVFLGPNSINSVYGPSGKGTLKAPKDASEVGIVVVARIQDILDPWEKGLGLRILDLGFRV